MMLDVMPRGLECWTAVLSIVLQAPRTEERLRDRRLSSAAEAGVAQGLGGGVRSAADADAGPIEAVERGHRCDGHVRACRRNGARLAG